MYICVCMCVCTCVHVCAEYVKMWVSVCACVVYVKMCVYVQGMERCGYLDVHVVEARDQH